MAATVAVPAQAQTLGTSAVTTIGPFVRANGTGLELDGRAWYLYGGATYGTTNPGGSQSVQNEIALARAGGLNTLRIVNMFDETGVNANAPTDQTAWERVDQILAAMQNAGLHAILDLSAFRNHLQNRELYVKGSAAIAASYPTPASCSSLTGDDLARCVGATWCNATPAQCTNPYSTDQVSAWDQFLSWVATRTNSVTGIQYRYDPTIAIVSFAGEPEPPNSQEPLRPGTQELTDFYARVFNEWKSLDPNHLVTSGGLLHIDWQALYNSDSGIDYQAIFALPNQDVLSIHNYFAQLPATATTDTKTAIVAAAAQSLNRPWITEEFGFPQTPVDGAAAYTELDRSHWFRNIYEIQQVPSQGVSSAGIAFWNLGPEVAGGSHDVNPGTPATWAVVKAYSPAPGRTTSRVSVTNDGGESPRGGDVGNSSKTVSADGRFVVFTSHSQLTPTDTGLDDADVYIRDRQAGTTELISVDSSGGQAFGDSTEPSISSDGRFVVFTSTAALDPMVSTSGPRHIYLRDLTHPMTPTTEIVSVTSDEQLSDSEEYLSAVSATGRYVTFLSRAKNFGSPTDTDSDIDVFLRDRIAGTTEQISITSNGLDNDTDVDVERAPVSENGRYVAFASASADLVANPADNNGRLDVFVRDRGAQTGPTTFRLSVGAGGEDTDDISVRPVMSDDGKSIAFMSGATNLVLPSDSLPWYDIFVADLTGPAPVILRASAGVGGAEANFHSVNESISEDGRFIAFQSAATNLAPNDPNGSVSDVWLFDRVDGSLRRSGGTDQGSSPSVNADASVVAFSSPSSNLVASDGNGSSDVFVSLLGEPSLTTPDPPTTLSATPGNGQVAVSWAAPANDGGAPIDGYVVTPVANGVSGSPISVSTTQTVVTGLVNGTSYTFSVLAHNSVGNSSAAVVGPVTPFGLPGMVGGVSVSYGDGTVTLNWPAPNANGSAVSRYLVTASRPGAPDVTQEALNGTLNSTFTTLAHCVPYTFTVRAVNNAGTGDASSAVNNVIPAAATTIQVGEAPQVTQTDVSFEPKQYRTISEQCTRVTWKFKSTNVKRHTVTERSAGTAGLGAASGPLFNSGQVAAGGEFTYLLMGAGSYQYRSTLDGTSPSLSGNISMPVNVTPATGPRTSQFTIRWAKAPMPGYSFTIRYLYKRDTAANWGSNWTTWGTNLTAASGTFRPPANHPAGTYLFSARLKNTATSRQGGWSWVQAPSATVSCVCALKTS